MLHRSPFFVLLLVLSQLHPSAAQDSTRAARITGQVVEAPGGVAVVDARVILESFRSAGRPNVREVITDVTGSFVLEDIQPGSYLIHAERAGYMTANLPAGYARPVPLSVNVEAGRTYPVTLRLMRTGSITGRVYDEHRQAVVKAEIQILSARYSGFGQRILTRVTIASSDGFPSVQSDDRGEYRVTGLPAGEYYIRAAFGTTMGPTVRNAQRANNAAPTYYPGVTDPDEAVPIKVASGLDANAIDFTLRPLPSTTIFGRIINPMTQTVRSYYDYFLVPRNARLREFLQAVPNQGGNDGEFELRNVRPGSYDLYVAFRTGTRPDDFQFYTGRTQLEVTDRNITDLVVAIEPGVQIPGRIDLDESARSARLDVRSIVLALAPLDGMPAILSPTAILGRSSFIQPDGTFLIRNAAHGRYFLTTQVNAGDLYVASARLGTQDILGRPFEIDSDTTGPLVIEVRGKGGSIEGKVITRDGTPVANGQVMLVPPINFREDQTAYRGAATDSQGRFTISGIRPGNYTAYAISRREDIGAWMNPAFITPYLNSAIELNISSGQNVQREFSVTALPQ